MAVAGTALVPARQQHRFPTLLAIDDSVGTLELIKSALYEFDLQIATANDPAKGLELFSELRPAIVLLDLIMAKISGMEVLQRILAADPGTEVILITAHYSTESAVEAIQKGACDYFNKPLDLARLRSRIHTLLADRECRRVTSQLDQALEETLEFEGVIGRSPLMLDLFAKIRRLAPHVRNTLVTGATGTGKELIARALHRLSPARSGSFVVCNCAALSESLLESELFGYVRGAFTGAVQDRPGVFQFANHGTVFLDEIGELPPPAQARLLRVLQNREVQRLGSPVVHQLDVRVIAATHRDLQAMVREGRFREDLYFRLSQAELSLPRLAERKEDLPLLTHHLIKTYSALYGKRITGVTRRAQIRLAAYSWPGNVRELENAISNGCLNAAGDTVDLLDLPSAITERKNDLCPEAELLPMHEVERRHLLNVLRAVGGNKARAAEILEVSRATVYQMLSRQN